MRGARILLGAALAVAAALAATAPAAAGELIAIETPSRNVDPSRAVFNGPPPEVLRANVLLPDGYTPRRRWPVLFLLHGIGDSYEAWAREDRGRIAETAAGLPAIVVMPEAGRGFYTNWFNEGRRGDPGWERFYLDELVPLVQRRFPIRRGRRQHAVAGLSMGGFGAAFIGGQRPDYFGAVAAFSGFVQHQRPEVGAGLRALGGPEYETIFGPVDGAYATGHNPTRLAANLRRTRVFVAAGDGTPEPGVAGSPAATTAGGVVEAGLRVQNEEFVAALRDAGVDVTYLPQAGVHDWPYWRRHLTQAIDWGLFGRGRRREPRAWSYGTVADRGRAWGLRYRFAEPPDAVVTLSRRGRRIRGVGPGGTGGRLRLTHVRTGCRITVAVPFERARPAGPRPRGRRCDRRRARGVSGPAREA